MVRASIFARRLATLWLPVSFGGTIRHRGGPALSAGRTANQSVLSAAGLYFEQTVTSDDAQAGMDMEVRGWAEGQHGRVEFVNSNSPIMRAGSYLLTSDGGQTTYLIDPEERTYSVWDLSEALSFIKQMEETSQGLVKIDIRDSVSETLATESGDTLLGYNTTRHTWRSGFTIDIKVVFANQSSRNMTTTDAWVAKDIDNPGIFIWLRPMPPTTGDEELDAFLTAEMERFDGVVLKMDQTTVITNKKGKKSDSYRTAFEVTNLREQAVDLSLFDFSDGYNETSLMPSMDESANADSEEDEGPMKSLKSLFGRDSKDG